VKGIIKVLFGPLLSRVQIVPGIVHHQWMERFLILFNRREAPNGFVEAVIVLIVIHQGHLPHQDAVLLSAELMRETGRKGSLRSASCFSSAPAHIDLQTIGATRFKSWNPRRSD